MAIALKTDHAGCISHYDIPSSDSPGHRHGLLQWQKLQLFSYQLLVDNVQIGVFDTQFPNLVRTRGSVRETGGF